MSDPTFTRALQKALGGKKLSVDGLAKILIKRAQDGNADAISLLLRLMGDTFYK